MNDEQKNTLAIMLNSLSNAQHDVSVGTFNHQSKLIDKRERIIDQIIDLVESFTCDEGNPLFDDLIYDDPRANLRPCYVHDCGKAFFHSWYTDADGEPSAIVEYPDGNVNVCMAWQVRFTDVARRRRNSHYRGKRPGSKR